MSERDRARRAPGPRARARGPPARSRRRERSAARARRGAARRRAPRAPELPGQVGGAPAPWPGFEVLDVRHRVFEPPEVQPLLHAPEAEPRVPARHGAIEPASAWRVSVRAPRARTRRTPAPAPALGPRALVRDGPAGVVRLREQLGAEQREVVRRGPALGFGQRRQRGLGAAPDEGIDLRDAAGEPRMPRGSLQRRHVQRARVVVIAGFTGVGGGARQRGRLQRARARVGRLAARTPAGCVQDPRVVGRGERRHRDAVRVGDAGARLGQERADHLGHRRLHHEPRALAPRRRAEEGAHRLHRQRGRGSGEAEPARGANDQRTASPSARNVTSKASTRAGSPLASPDLRGRLPDVRPGTRPLAAVRGDSRKRCRRPRGRRPRPTAGLRPRRRTASPPRSRVAGRAQRASRCAGSFHARALEDAALMPEAPRPGDASRETSRRQRDHFSSVTSRHASAAVFSSSKPSSSAADGQPQGERVPATRRRIRRVDGPLGALHGRASAAAARRRHAGGTVDSRCFEVRGGSSRHERSIHRSRGTP